MDDNTVLVNITPEKLKLAYDEFLKVSEKVSEDREFLISLGRHNGKHVILKWFAEKTTI